MKKRRLKQKFKVFLTIYFVVFTSFFALTTFSKYAGMSTGSGTATVAKWEISFQGDTNANISIVKGNTTQEYKLTVTSSSDVGVSYYVIISNVPDGVQAKVDSKNYIPASNGEIRIENVGIINANDAIKTKVHTLTFDAALTTQEKKKKKMDIDVMFTQIIP